MEGCIDQPEMNEVVVDNRADLTEEEINLLNAVVHLVWLQCRHLDEDEKTDILEAVLNFSISLNARNTFKREQLNKTNNF